MEQLSATLRTLRARNRHTQQFIAKELGITQSQYAKIENGDKDLTVPALIKLASIYRLQVHTLLEAIIVGLDAGKPTTPAKINGEEEKDISFYRQLAQHYEHKAITYLHKYIELCQKQGLDCLPS